MPLSHRTGSFTLLPIFGLLSASIACSSGATSQVGTDTLSDAGTSGDASTTEAAAGPSTPKESCAAYIQCISEFVPSAAGPLVTLYGEASSCWKGSDADALACGRACSNDESYPGCTDMAISGEYALACAPRSSSGLFFADATVEYSNRDGGTMLLKVFNRQQPTYDPSKTVMTQPTVPLTRAPEGGKGKSPAGFSAPAGTYTSWPTTITSFEVSKLRKKGAQTCVKFDVSDAERSDEASCIFLPLKPGSPWPTLDYSKVVNCEDPNINIPAPPGEK